MDEEDGQQQQWFATTQPAPCPTDNVGYESDERLRRMDARGNAQVFAPTFPPLALFTFADPRFPPSEIKPEFDTSSTTFVRSPPWLLAHSLHHRFATHSHRVPLQLTTSQPHCFGMLGDRRTDASFQIKMAESDLAEKKAISLAMRLNSYTSSPTPPPSLGMAASA